MVHMMASILYLVVSSFTHTSFPVSDLTWLDLCQILINIGKKKLPKMPTLLMKAEWGRICIQWKHHSTHIEMYSMSHILSVLVVISSIHKKYMRICFPILQEKKLKFSICQQGLTQNSFSFGLFSSSLNKIPFCLAQIRIFFTVLQFSYTLITFLKPS